MVEFVMDWVVEPGYPLLTVDVDMNSNVISLRQVLTKIPLLYPFHSE